MKEENPFEDKTVAQEWIDSIENQGSRTREMEIYPMLNSWVKEFKPETIIEVGSGQGICSAAFDTGELEYVGIEPSEYLLHRAQEKYANAQRTFVQGDAYSLPLDAESADAAFSVGVWFHIDDLDRAHAELARVLRKDGRLLIFTADIGARDVWESWFDKPKVDGKRVQGAVFVPGGRLSKNIFYFHSTKEIAESLEKHGFIIEDIKTIGFGGGERTRGIWVAIRAKKK